MSDWTKKNFNRLRDVSPKGEPMRWKMARDALGTKEVGVSRFSYEPGARMPFGHRHREQEEVYVVVGGSGHAKLDDELVELATWDVLRVSPPVVRSFVAGPDGLDLLCIGGKRPKGGDSERFPDFWDDELRQGAPPPPTGPASRPPRDGRGRGSGSGST
jgi:quercetin dioxygenase-like cupin family protein